MGDIHDDLREVMGLLPCPFCGGEARLNDVTPYFWTVNCTGCETEGAPFPSSEESVSAWNTRPALLAAAKYEEANPLGGPATMLEAAARRIRAGEDFHEVLADYGLLARQEGEDWLPIESAPRDGTVILVWGEFAGEIGGPYGEPLDIGVASWQGGRTDYPGYDWRAENTDAYAGWWKPTHWRPRPAPPAARSGGGG